ncbi:uncharacterized protein MELLADRAFT_85117 [Melampsora larici-populina 98AG31]|uniref:DUF38 domain-containing protein n=1 Tax=Melampsora larici-populina (strain 98AG31 / pathotype 3-4-7) TaxID=747676 RepID=F4SAD1_MELLP|nr:uncharacterized protein MELLADRAFT_95716 [Melampsora larici-populina 98AG31]XP_007419224.1 uncharacterized protein MELLADRAFT_85117 [Melampsora larici-populina 98AG31]EGF97502.1 hypothetical protein MELLADRAFT_85117 [Melampsora larici-populina 98AG31]EGF98366.1 hypothetical protein MELLADRAFT_95716 [Melampsora larici-populina 98AG31]
MNQLATLIELLGKKLKTLSLCFVYHNNIGISPRVIKAIENIEDLKSFMIFSGHEDSKYRTRNLKSITELFSAMPKIEWLKFMCGAIKKLDFKPTALTNLRCLSFSYDKNSKVLSNIIRTSKSTLKFIELNSAFEDCQDLIQIFEPIQDTLEGLGTMSFSEDLPAEFASLDFPKLRVLIDQSTRPYRVMRATNEHVLAAPMLRNVRTVVTAIESTTYRSYWDLTDLLVGVEEVPSFKHFVLTKEAWIQDYIVIPPKFMEDYKSRGVQLHVTNQVSCDELMELDLKLNGPMN